ncbi:ABC multidrug transporter H [Fulvia fulva]|uniref:ABC multidrug transporter H n=1 Tax=Passalora fulva TaxID=5499 RepID=A0A9Q8LFE9_PASFU|nr:ABC multidrug transporter H [Fulvia fulva]KAK4629104.1 ABC multidrug transporter H [Fulvia fulva]KAK4630198.1 ABC multidrug transporter H [Fulvia fulva]UJO15668.1 ABC multidrug transporter H [Fulvia fulva]WPV12129.1 ABC multidrug transporter H [Fulvia fulva]WPV27715.1 ABC multidrug transporter H [Fulvia fulva]
MPYQRAESGFSVGSGAGSEIYRTVSHALAHTLSSKTPQEPIEDGEDDSDMEISKADDWHMMAEVKEMLRQTESDGAKEKRLGVTWKNLTVKGVGADAAFHENVLSQYDVSTLFKESRQKPPLKTIVEDSHGCVKPGEMILVLGRPGAGCTSLLKMLSNRRLGYAEVTGDVRFGSMDHKEAEQFRGQIVMNTEEELFFPTLTVKQTMDFATRMKVPSHLPGNLTSAKEYQNIHRDFLMRSMGIEHTYNTKVGNEYVRGVSGGERKRVSIIETMASRGSVYCWDNSTRGLDASTALEYTKCIRALTDILGLSSIVTLYQAGNGIYDLFDKVLVLDEGKQIFYGPMPQAKPFMEELGFMYTDGANVADFLTGVTVPTERRVKPGMEHRAPRTAEDIRAYYEKTNVKYLMESEYSYPDSDEAKQYTEAFKESVTHERNPSLPKKSPLTVSFYTQVSAAVIRQYQLLWGDKATFFITQGATIAQSLIAGSLFYDAPANSSGLFSKGGALFFALLYNSLLSMSEVTNSFAARPVLAKHRGFALYHPAAFCIAQIAADIPLILVQVTLYSIPAYFMTGLKDTAGAFFTFWVLCFAVTMTMTACFRSIGAAFPNFDAASKVSGFLISALIMYTGYMIAKPDMHPWFVWIYWIDPLAYGYEALSGNEFAGQVIPCVNNNLVPNGPGYADNRFQACTGVRGAQVGAASLTGEEYLEGLSYSADNVWRNFAIIWAWWALFAALTIYFTSKWSMISGNSGFLVIPREKAKKAAHLVNDKESLLASSGASEKSSRGFDDEKPRDTNVDSQLIRNTSIFTWKNLTYTVKTPTGDRILLDNVQGWVKPGMLGALMGSSGAGKTTLLDVLAQRKTDGTIKGSVLVDGRELPVSFQRSAGYCEQLDVHEPLATVREALEFSALLRQSRDIPKAEKLKYVDTIIDLLEMHDIENTLIGTTSAGLSVEQRKRLTIGVELVSKPSILIFLDEPTSGLDGQAAFNIVRFLRKLADVGQAVLVTIHQPSASLFAQFDTLLLLAKGGKTVYFGDIGDNASTIRDYFGRYGAPCPTHANPAEHMIDVVSGSLSKGRDWNQVWLESPEYSNMNTELDRMVSDAASKPPGTTDDGHEFAMGLWDQIKLVTHRNNISLYRNVEYANNKFSLHIGSGLFNGFTFWMIGNSVADLQLRLFTIFNFIFVAPGVMAQLQPLFIDRRDIYEAREKKSKMYHWSAFATGLIVSEIPYLVICAILYFVTWYWTVGFPRDSNKAGATFFVMLCYEFIYTGIGQAVAAYAPNAVFATLTNPLIITLLASFCGVLLPYDQIQSFWRYWMYYLNPYNYLMGSMLVFSTFDVEVTCKTSELAIFNTPNGETCAEYLAGYLQGFGSRTNLLNPMDTTGCQVCQYRTGADYLYALNLKDYYYGWRDAGITALFVFSSYGCVYLLMKLRTKASKKAE